MYDTFSSEGFSGVFNPACLMIEEPQVAVHEGYWPDLLAELLDADVLAGEDTA